MKNINMKLLTEGSQERNYLKDIWTEGMIERDIGQVSVTWLKWWQTLTMEFNSGLMSPMSQVCHGWHHPNTFMEMGWKAFLFVKLWVLWTGYHTGTGDSVQFINPLETRISSTSLYLEKAHVEDNLWALHHPLAHSGYGQSWSNLIS